MERQCASADLRPKVAATGPDGLERTYPVVLRLTYDFSRISRRMSIVAQGLIPGADEDDPAGWASAYHTTSDAAVVGAWTGFIATARALVKLMRLPDDAAFPVSSHLGSMADRLQPFVQDCFLGRCCAPVEPVSLVPKGDLEAPGPDPQPTPPDRNVLIQVDRDISGIFGAKEGACLLEYTLFSEPALFRCVIALFEGKRRKVLDFYKKEVSSIIRHLESDELAFEIAGWYGNSDSHIVHLVGSVLKHSFARLTKPPAPLTVGPEIPRNSDPDAPTRFIAPIRPVKRDPADETIPLVPVDPAETVEVYNGGYFPLRG